eukprot:980555-Amphidinium_carterae.3
MEAEAEGPSSRKKAVLVNHGSFNPPHWGHIQMMAKAKLRLEVAGYEVVIGLMAITNRARIWQKSAKALPDQFRVELINRLSHAAHHSMWLKGDIRGNEFKSYWQMAENVLQQEYPDHVIFGVVGGDYCCGRFPDGPCVCVHRQGFADPKEDIAEDHFLVKDEEAHTYSSTRLRKALADMNQQELDALMGQEAVQLLLKLPEKNWKSWEDAWAEQEERAWAQNGQSWWTGTSWCSWGGSQWKGQQWGSFTAYEAESVCIARGLVICEEEPASSPILPQICPYIDPCSQRVR